MGLKYVVHFNTKKILHVKLSKPLFDQAVSTADDMPVRVLHLKRRSSLTGFPRTFLRALLQM